MEAAEAVAESVLTPTVVAFMELGKPRVPASTCIRCTLTRVSTKSPPLR